jgi:hypothetical protein
MKAKRYLYLVLLSVLSLMFLAMPVISEAQQPQESDAPRPSNSAEPQVPPTNPSEIPNQGKGLEPVPEDRISPLPEIVNNQPVISWGSLMLGVLIGAVLGYFLWARRPDTADARRDRAA